MRVQYNAHWGKTQSVALWTISFATDTHNYCTEDRIQDVRVLDLPDLPDATETVAHGGQTGPKVFVKKTYIIEVLRMKPAILSYSIDLSMLFTV